MTAEMLTPYTCKIKFEVKSNERQTFLLLSDVHWDNPHCDRDLLKRHLDEAITRNAGILIFGDLFCAMQGKYDPRGSKAGIRPEHNVANYLDKIVDDAIDYFKPYAQNIMYVSPGNHECSLLKRQETDIIYRFTQGVGCLTGAYSGWVLFNVTRNSRTRIVNMSYHHGYGGGGPVTKDVIQASRKAVYLPDADIVVSGHVHDRWVFPIMRVHLNNITGKQELREQLHLKLGTYKDEYTEGNGWAIEKGHPPKSLGGVWLHIDHERDTIDGKDIEKIKVKAELA